MEGVVASVSCYENLRHLRKGTMLYLPVELKGVRDAINQMIDHLVAKSVLARELGDFR